MNSIKTAFVMVALLGAGYGGFLLFQHWTTPASVPVEVVELKAAGVDPTQAPDIQLNFGQGAGGGGVTGGVSGSGAAGGTAPPWGAAPSLASPFAGLAPPGAAEGAPIAPAAGGAGPGSSEAPPYGSSPMETGDASDAGIPAYTPSRSESPLAYEEATPRYDGYGGGPASPAMEEELPTDVFAGMEDPLMDGAPEAPHYGRATDSPGPGNSAYHRGYGESNGGATETLGDAPYRGRSRFDDAWEAAERNIQLNELAEALRTLTPLAHDASLSPGDRRRLLRRLDGLAGEVVYSTSSYLLPAYQARGGESLADVAHHYRAPAELLANINNLSPDTRLAAGQTIKVVPGPFAATISVSTGEITLTVDGCYAGRFPFTLGEATRLREGESRVATKVGPRDLAEFGQAGTSPGIGLSLSDGARIRTASGLPRGEGLIVSDHDAKDLCAILSEGSAVTVLR